MDQLADSFNGLSTSAREWTPNQPSNHSRSDRSGSIDSELNAASVKEFVPGQGWSTTATSRTTSITSASSNTSTSNNATYYEDPSTQEQAQQPEGILSPDTVLPAGPTCPGTFRSLHSLAMSDDLWAFHRDATLQSLRQMPPMDPRHKAVPPPYMNGYCVDDKRSQTFGFLCQTFQVWNRNDGYQYCLRRYESIPKQYIPPRGMLNQLLEDWASVEHANLVPLSQAFMAHRSTIFFVHYWIPNAYSVRDYIANNNNSNASNGGGLNERLLWSALCQLVAVLRRTHAAMSASRTQQSARRLRLGLSKSLTLRQVLIQTNLTKVSFYINSCGIADVLYENNNNNNRNNSNNHNNHHGSVEEEEDIRQLGRLILAMAAGSTEITAQTDASTLQSCERYLLQNFSRELHNLIMTLIKSPTPPSIVDVSRALAGRVWEEWDHVQLTLERTERALAAEYESGRALRLLLKLGFINERPEFGPNRRWQQSGDCYVLTLFRDYVFHQADGAGNPVMDLGHVITALNKLDAADEEKIVLSSRDGKSLMVVSYADVARCLDSAYHELCAGSVPPPTAAGATGPTTAGGHHQPPHHHHHPHNHHRPPPPHHHHHHPPPY